MKHYVFDSGAFIALERRDERMIGLTRRLVRQQHTFHTTAGVIAQVWRNPAKQHELAVLLKSGALVAHPLTETVGKQLGFLLGRSATSDVTDMHVAFVARQLDAQLLTSDPGDFRGIDPSLRIVTI